MTFLSQAWACVRTHSIVVLAAVLAPWVPAHAADYPTKPIEFIVPFAPGGTSDIIGRIVAQELQNELGVSVIVSNRPGAAGTVGLRAVSRAAPDGYTLGIAGSTALTVAPYLQNPPIYETQKVFTPLAVLASSPFILAVSPKMNVQNIQEFIALAKKNPGALNYGSSGVGGIHHVMTELFNQSVGIKATHIPLKGGAENVNNLLSGTIDYIFESAPSILAHIKGGTIKGIGVTSAKRQASYPDVPTMVESGATGFVIEPFVGLVAPANLPAPVKQKLLAALKKISEKPSTREVIRKTGQDPSEIRGAEFSAMLDDEIRKWQKVINDLGLRTIN